MDQVFVNELTSIVGPLPQPGEAGRMARALRRKPAYVPSNDNPIAELQRLVKEHRALVRKSVAIRNMVSDRTLRETGEVIPCNIPEDARTAARLVAKLFDKEANALESAMLKELRKVDIYNEFLSKVFGCGTIIAAYLVAYIHVAPWTTPDGKPGQYAEKPSNLRRFCGLAVIDGRLERPTRGVKLGYCSELRMRLYQMFSAMLTNRRHDTGSPYLKVWSDYKHRMQNSERVVGRKVSEKDGLVDGTIVNGQEKKVSARGFIHSTGWHKAADVFIEDLYIMWRALEGLPVWPDYRAAKLGYSHGGKICVNAPRMLTLAEARESVGL